jgi:hypothetical protein
MGDLSLPCYRGGTTLTVPETADSRSVDARRLAGGRNHPEGCEAGVLPCIRPVFGPN